MSNYLLYLVLFFNLSLYAQYSDPNRGVPTFHGSAVDLNFNYKLQDIYHKTQLHISNKADSLFIKRMKLKENDSIQFKLSYLINKEGLVVSDSTTIETGIPSFDNYIKLMVASLPKFIPAIDLIKKENRKYRISMVSEFVVKNKKLTLFETNKAPNHYFPIFQSCAKDKTDKTQCHAYTYQVISRHLDLSKLNFPSSIKEIRFLVNFSIDEKGRAKDIQLIRSSEIRGFKEAVLRAFDTLPEFYVPEDHSAFLAHKFTLPITISISGNIWDQPNSNLQESY